MDTTKDIKVEVIAKETIKPSSPTPHHLRTCKLCFMDQYATKLYIPMVLFYANSSGVKSGDDYEKMVVERSNRLKESLSEALTHFYPLAGRLRNNIAVDCNDEGVHYMEARVINCCLSDILKQPMAEHIVPFVPIPPTDLDNAPLLLIQASFFPCGGLAITVRMSHKIADGAAFATFIKGWSQVALGSPADMVVPDFKAASSRFPPKEDFPIMSMTFPVTNQKLVTKRFVVEASKIAGLKVKGASASVPQPTRVETVTALIWKCAVSASRSRLGGSPRACGLTGAVNSRSRLVPPFPKYSFGNLVGLLWANFDNDDKDNESSEMTKLQGLVHRLRKGIEEATDNNFSMTKRIAKLKEQRGEDMVLYLHSSWCKFPVYEADFGWGKPTWATGMAYGSPVGMTMFHTSDGEGVEVWLTLHEDDMMLFENDQELLAFASPNPSVL